MRDGFRARWAVLAGWVGALRGLLSYLTAEDRPPITRPPRRVRPATTASRLQPTGETVAPQPLRRLA
jgi:hypothetical protein